MNMKSKLALLGLLSVVFGLWSEPLQAAQARLFEVGGIEVDVTAASAAQARAEAQSQGERMAFNTLLQRLTLQAYHDRLPQPTAAEISSMIQDFAVGEEKASSVRYIARMGYRFRANAIRALLDANAIPYAETSSKPVLMLPVYQSAGALMLWDDPNPWRAAWEKYLLESPQGLVPMVMPVGDLEDLRTIGAEQAIDGDMALLEEIALRYDAGDVVVAHAIMRMDAFGSMSELEVYLTRFGSALQEQTVVKSFTATPGEETEALLQRAAGQLTAQAEDNWKQDNMIQVGAAQVLPISVPVQNLESWVTVRERLNGVAIVQNAEMVLLRRDAVRLNLHFIGDAEQLALSLDQADLVLWQEAGFWYLAPKTRAY